MTRTAATHGPINLGERLISYGEDRKAASVAPDFARLAAAPPAFILGLSATGGDDSVHSEVWERHCGGDELLVVLEGGLVAVLEGAPDEEVRLGAGEALIVPRGRWHRLVVTEPGRMLFFSPAAGTEMRPAGQGTQAEARS